MVGDNCAREHVEDIETPRTGAHFVKEDASCLEIFMCLQICALPCSNK